MKKWLSLVLTVLMAASFTTPLQAAEHPVYVDDQFVGNANANGETLFSIPIVATAETLDLDYKLDDATKSLIFHGRRVPYDNLIQPSGTDPEYYVPLLCFEQWGWQPKKTADGSIYLTTPKPQNHDITILLNGVELYSDVSPVIRNGRTYIPFRSLFENLGAEVSYHENIQNVRAASDFTVLDMRLNSGKYGMLISEYGVYEANRICIFERPEKPFVENGRTYVPVRFPSEAIGADVKWDGATRTITISTNTYRFTPPADAVNLSNYEAYHNALFG